jgi:hypothetical protein
MSMVRLLGSVFDRASRRNEHTEALWVLFHALTLAEHAELHFRTPIRRITS